MVGRGYLFIVVFFRQSMQKKKTPEKLFLGTTVLHQSPRLNERKIRFIVKQKTKTRAKM